VQPCHGAARGQDGFRLSLWGFDPDGDHYRLTREFSGRRITSHARGIDARDQGTGAAPHTAESFWRRTARWRKRSSLGGQWCAERSAGCRQADESRDPAQEAGAREPGQNFKITVRVHYSDGTDRDVTNLGSS